MLKNRYAKNTYGPKCQNTHGPKLWLLDTWAWAHGLGPWPGPRARAWAHGAPGKCVVPGGGAAARAMGAGPWAQAHVSRSQSFGP